MTARPDTVTLRLRRILRGLVPLGQATAFAGVVSALTATSPLSAPRRDAGAPAGPAHAVAPAAPRRAEKPQAAKLTLASPVFVRAVGFAESEPLRNFPADKVGAMVDEPFRFRLREPEEDEHREVNDRNTEGTGVEPDPSAPPQAEGALYRGSPTRLKGGAGFAMPSPSLTFEGLSAADNTAVFGTTVAPPDPTGAVGPNDYVQTTNNLVRVYDKNGNPRGPAFKLSGLFASLGGVTATNDQGDTIVLYDRMANRWMISQFAFTSQTTPPFHQAIAVSKTADPTGPYWVWDFVMPGAEFNDYFKFGAWSDAYYMTDRQFTNGGPFNSFGCFAFDRAKMLVGDPTAGYIYFNLGTPNPLLSNASSGMIPTDFTGLTPPPPGSPNVFAVYTDDAYGDAADTIRLFNFHADFTTPANSTFTERPESPVAVASFDSRNPSGRADVEQPAPAVAGDSLDTLGDRLMLRLQYINRGGTESLLATHTVNAGTIPSPGFLPTRAQYVAGIRYYELRKASPGGTYTVAEQATFSPNTTERWMGSVAMDNAGNIAAGYSLSSTSVFPSLGIAGRLAGDPPNGLAQGETTLFAGTGVQRGTSNRWGDYTSLQLDPSDDATFWYVNQYYATSPTTGFDWHTRIGRFKFPGTVAPAQGTLSGTITACDSGAPLADAIVTVSGGPSSGFSATTAANGTYSMNLLPGAYSVTVTDSTHACVNAGPFPVNVNPGVTTTFDQCLGGTPVFALVSTAVTGGDGDAMVEVDECNDLTVTIRNTGCQTGTGLVGVLSTATPNVTVTQATSSYPDLAVNATGANLVKFSISTSASFVAGTPIVLQLTVNATTGSPSVLTFTLPTNVAPPVTITGTIGAGDATFTGLRMTRNGVGSSCVAVKSCPGQTTGPSGTRAYDAYTFTNGGGIAACATVTLTNTCGNNIFGMCFSGSFDPNNHCTNYLADPGVSGSTVSWTFTVPAGGSFVLVVHEVTPGGGCGGYSATVSGLYTNSTGGGACASDLALTSSAPSTVYQNSSYTYAYTLTNNGPSTAADVKIDTTIPAGTTFLSANAPGASSLTTPAVGATGAVNATWLGATPSGGTHQLFLTVNVPASTAVGTVISNTATASYPFTDPNPANNTALATSTVAVASLPVLAPVANQTANEGSTAAFTVVASGPGPFSYQWYQDGVGAIPGANGPTLNVTAYQWLSGATFYCLVTNAYGIMTSNHAALTVIPAGFSATSFSPTSGPVGAVVNFYGGDFTGVSAVSFNGTPAAFSVLNSGWMQATVPPGATTGYVWLTSPLGTEIPHTMFTVSTAGPVITSFTPAFGVGGTTVVITGTGFTGATAVKFNGVNATIFTVNSATQITAKVPVYTTSGPITVVTPLGSGTSASAFVKF